MLLVTGSNLTSLFGSNSALSDKGKDKFNEEIKDAGDCKSDSITCVWWHIIMLIQMCYFLTLFHNSMTSDCCSIFRDKHNHKVFFHQRKRTDHWLSVLWEGKLRVRHSVSSLNSFNRCRFRLPNPMVYFISTLICFHSGQETTPSKSLSASSSPPTCVSLSRWSEWPGHETCFLWSPLCFPLE